MLNSNKSKKELKWNSKYNLEKSIKVTSAWFKEYIDKKDKNILEVTKNQIREYLNQSMEDKILDIVNNFSEMNFKNKIFF